MRNRNIFSMSIASDIPDAFAVILGGEDYPDIAGMANFYRTRWDVGLMVEIELINLPNSADYSPRFLGMNCAESFPDKNFENNHCN